MNNDQLDFEQVAATPVPEGTKGRIEKLPDFSFNNDGDVRDTINLLIDAVNSPKYEATGENMLQQQVDGARETIKDQQIKIAKLFLDVIRWNPDNYTDLLRLLDLQYPDAGFGDGAQKLNTPKSGELKPTPTAQEAEKNVSAQTTEAKAAFDKVMEERNQEKEADRQAWIESLVYKYASRIIDTATTNTTETEVEVLRAFAEELLKGEQ